MEAVEAVEARRSKSGLPLSGSSQQYHQFTRSASLLPFRRE
jgi:hypothetical protein